MPSLWRSLPLVVVCAVLTALPADAQQTSADKPRPCEAYSQASAVFVGIAGAPVKKRVQLPNQPPIEMTLTPMTVERAYVGVITQVMYLTPLGPDIYPTEGKRYLVYGRAYRPPDIVMASPGAGAKEIERAADDLAFLDGSALAVKGGTISGVIQHKEVTASRATSGVAPLERIAVRVFNARHAAEAVTGADGRFSLTLPAGTYQIVPELPEDLVVPAPTGRIEATVDNGGCATVTIDALFNGRIRGVVRGPDGLPLPATSVDLLPMDVAPEPGSGHIKGTGSVTTNDRGEFEFTGRPSGRYYLGVSLYNAPNPTGPAYPRTYYPGTTDRASATPIVIERGRPSDGFDFSIPTILSKGEIEVTVDSEYAGELKLCYLQLEDLFSRSSSFRPRRGVPMRLPVVDGQRYEVHVHLTYPGGHLESEPFVFTATTDRTIVRLRPDAPRELH